MKRDLPAVDGLLRLAAKYECGEIHAHVAKRVRKWWPSALNEWDVLVATGLVKKVLVGGNGVEGTEEHGRPDFGASLVLAARTKLHDPRTT